MESQLCRVVGVSCGEGALRECAAVDLCGQFEQHLGRNTLPASDMSGYATSQLTSVVEGVGLAGSWDDSRSAVASACLMSRCEEVELERSRFLVGLGGV